MRHSGNSNYHTLRAYYELDIVLRAKCMPLNLFAQRDHYFYVTDKTTEAQGGFLGPLLQTSTLPQWSFYTNSFKCHL